MTGVKVRRDGLDWVAECEDHADYTWCSDWISAMESAWGHVVMHHSRRDLG